MGATRLWVRPICEDIRYIGLHSLLAKLPSDWLLYRKLIVNDWWGVRWTLQRVWQTLLMSSGHCGICWTHKCLVDTPEGPPDSNRGPVGSQGVQWNLGVSAGHHQGVPWAIHRTIVSVHFRWSVLSWARSGFPDWKFDVKLAVCCHTC